MAPSINNKIRELTEKLEEVPYSKQDAPLESTLKDLKYISDELKETNELAKKIMNWQVAL
jgi:hypothetical protein